MDKDTRGRCVYCNSQAVNGAFICHNCYEKLMLIRKLRAIVFQIKAQATMGNHEGEDKNK